MESENSYEAPDILDMLFDDCGILKTEMKLDSIPFEDEKKMINYSNYDESDISNVNFGDFDLTENLFESLLNQAEPNSFFEEEPPKKCTSFHTDHTYIAQKSPSEHSDSGISVVSDDSQKNMTDDQLAKIQYQTHQPCDSSMDISPLPSDSHIFDLIGFDNGENEVNDSSYYSPNHDGQVATDYLDDFDSSPGMNDEEFSIDFDTDEFDTNLHDKGTQSILLIDGITKKIIPLKKNGKDGNSLPFTMRDVDPYVTNSTDFPKLRLTDEEKDLLNREGVTLPSHLPLTREEERVLKSVRRKIRNKVSAKESRKRKQTYVDGLEQRVKLCTAENRELQKKVCSLEKQNFTLISQLKRVQSLVGKSKLSANASTCVMVLLLSFALFVIPAFDPFGSSSNENHSPVSMSSQSVRGKARSLLEENTNELAGSDEDPYGVTSRPAAPWARAAMPMSATPKMTEASIEDTESEVKESPRATDDNSQNAIPSRDDVGKDGRDLNFVSEDVLPTENITSDHFQSSNDVNNVNQNVEV